MPVSLSSGRSFSRLCLPLTWMDDNDAIARHSGNVTVTVSGPYGISTVVVSVDIIDGNLAVAKFGSDVEDAYYTLFNGIIPECALMVVFQ